MDWNTFDYDVTQVFMMISQSLEGTAHNQSVGYFEMGVWSKEDRPEEFLEFLEFLNRANNDPTRVKRAANELHDLKMREKQRWTSFYPVWANKLTEAQGDTWPDKNKITIVQRALNGMLLQALSGNHLLPIDNFAEFISIVNKVSHQVDHLEGLISYPVNSSNSQKRAEPSNYILPSSDNSQVGWSVPGSSNGKAGQLDSGGDTIMGGVNVANMDRGPDGQPLRAKWNSRDQIASLKKERRCYRCERKGCGTRRFPFLPAVNPNRGPQVNVAALPPIDLSLCESAAGERDITVEEVLASSEEISKALRVKPQLTTAEARSRLPDEIKDFAHLFADDSGADELPPPRGHLDHAINLKQEDETPLQPPWGPLYGMSREELLILRKTLTELLCKGWIQSSGSPAAAPVLFARKPSGGLRFCVDYRGLNATTISDRYPLPLFKETLRKLSKARYFTKLDVKSAFHQEFSEIAVPLKNLTKKDSPWKWGAEQEKAFKKLETIFASEPVLAQWDPDRETILEADCSGYALRGCLTQKYQQGILRPVAYFSKRLSSAKVNYPIHDKEMHAIVSCLQEWRPELLSVSKPFTILIGHKNLSFFSTKRLLNERQVRYNDVLHRFNFKLEWRPGSTCERPDALSRRDQDKPTGLDDERNSERIMQLLPEGSPHPSKTRTPNLSSSFLNGSNNAADEDRLTSGQDPAINTRLFDDDEMHTLWQQGVLADKDWRRARDVVKSGERCFPLIYREKVWLNLKHVNTPQLSKKLAWLHHKYEVIAVPDALKVELNVPGNVHNRFHVELVKRAGTDPFPSQIRDDAQNPPVIDDLVEPEYEIESIMRARTVRRGRGTYRQVLVLWAAWADPTWEPIEYIEDAKALETFESIYGSILDNDGPNESNVGAFVGPAEAHTKQTRRERRSKRISQLNTKGGG
ncbi:hypothetical protein K3495_g3795 [Podosphaera aphanis]|nr:hypothetical protein K3495_g3795 [Podosphaera aphanis]